MRRVEGSYGREKEGGRCGKDWEMWNGEGLCLRWNGLVRRVEEKYGGDVEEEVVDVKKTTRSVRGKEEDPSWIEL